jgi:hypothetical protein
MLHTCPRCNEILNSKNAIAWHAIQEERCYPSSFDRIADKVQSRIDSLQGQVDFLLYIKPETRSSDDWLEKWHQVFFQHTHYYDHATQAFIEKKGIPAQSVKFKVKQASLGRLRRYTQREDLVKYHAWTSRTNPERILIPHECMRASRQIQLIRSIEAAESTREWARR